MIRIVLIFLFSFFTFAFLSASSTQPYPSKYSIENKKVLLCGVCRDVEPAIPNDIAQMERIGKHCADYAVIICEDNSKDKTVALFKNWAQKNEHVIFSSEIYNDSLLCKEERIARARNKVLKIASDPKYRDFDYLIMADLDFTTPWPVDEILRTLYRGGDWDCVSSNGMVNDGLYWNRSAYRNEIFPLGPDLIGIDRWMDDDSSFFKIDPNEEEWIPVYSAFGGLAIYKTTSILPFSYSGKATPDLKEYYRRILLTTPPYSPQLQKYLQKINVSNPLKMKTIPIIFVTDVCCEHLPLHASMTLHGFDKFFINPKLVIYY